MVADGQRVVYAGDALALLLPGDLGKVVSMAGDSAHVRWISGLRAGQIDLVPLYELVEGDGAVTSVADPEPDSFADSLDVIDFGLHAVGVRTAMDTRGLPGVVSALDDAGLLASLVDAAEEAHSLLVDRVGSNAGIRTALLTLDIDERAEVVRRIAATLLTEQLTEG